jgi:hypothetical protein
VGIFQPTDFFNKRTEDLMNYVRSDLNKNEIFDFSSLNDNLHFTDYVHIDQKSKNIVVDNIYPIVKKILENKDLC